MSCLFNLVDLDDDGIRNQGGFFFFSTDTGTVMTSYRNRTRLGISEKR